MANSNSPLPSDQDHRLTESPSADSPQVLPPESPSDPLHGPVKLHRLTGMLADRIAAGVSHDSTDLLSRILEYAPAPNEDPFDAVIPLQNLIRVCLHHSAHDVADPLLVRLIELKEQKSEDSPEVATLVASLAKVRYALGDHESSEDLSRYVLEAREKLLAPNHFGIVTALEHLADACSARGKLGEAIALLQRARTIRYVNLGSDHESIRGLDDRISDLELQTDDAPVRKTPRRALPPVQHLGAGRGRSDESSQAFMPKTTVPIPEDVFLKRTLPSAERPHVREPLSRPLFPVKEEVPPASSSSSFYSRMLMQIGADTGAEDQPKSLELKERFDRLSVTAVEFARAHYKPLVLGGFILMLGILAYAANASRPQRGKWTTDEQYQRIDPPAVAPTAELTSPTGSVNPATAAAGFLAPSVVSPTPVQTPPKVEAPSAKITQKPVKKRSARSKKRSRSR